LYGIFSVAERYRAAANMPVYSLTEPYLHEPQHDAESYVCVDAALFPHDHLVQMLLQLENGETLVDSNNRILAWQSNSKPVFNQLPGTQNARVVSNVTILETPGDILSFNQQAILFDLKFLPNSSTTFNARVLSQVIGPAENLYVEEGAEIFASTINCNTGPVIIRKGALVMEGTQIRGPVSIGEGAVVKMGACIYGATTIGKKCTVGGEIKNSILMDYSNKAHEGYLGDSMVGSWCNLGAGTSVSNVRNTGGTVPVWSAVLDQFVPAGIKAGLLMGDYSRSAINTSFNTGTVVGACSSVHQPGLTPRHIPSFIWGNHSYILNKAIEHVANWKRLKGQNISTLEVDILTHLAHNNK
jgi:UDP-N-acetylglucosamine diphosphorylase/glucosamine-1-phosphate N-acetyltransferase